MPFIHYTYIHTYLIDHSPLGLFRANETNNWNELNRLTIPTGRPVGYAQVQPRSWTKDYLEQIQLVVRAGLELEVFRFQIDTLTTRPRWLLILFTHIILFTHVEAVKYKCVNYVKFKRQWKSTFISIFLHTKLRSFHISFYWKKISFNWNKKT